VIYQIWDGVLYGGISKITTCKRLKTKEIWGINTQKRENKRELPILSRKPYFSSALSKNYIIPSPLRNIDTYSYAPFSLTPHLPLHSFHPFASFFLLPFVPKFTPLGTNINIKGK
jgi:hypothetical protein